MARKKLNPKRIPIAKREINTEKIVEEAMKDDMAHAWLLVTGPLLSYISIDELGEMADAVNRFIKKGSESGKNDLARISEIVQTKKPRVDPSGIRSAVDLEKFRKKVERIALHTGLCVVCLGLESTGRFSNEDLKQIFFSADLTLAEIESGVNSYDEIERELLSHMVKIEMDAEDLCKVDVGAPV